MGHRGTSFDDAIAADEHFAGADERAVLHVEHVGGMEHDDAAGNGASLRLERMNGGES